MQNVGRIAEMGKKKLKKKKERNQKKYSLNSNITLEVGEEVTIDWEKRMMGKKGREMKY